MPSADQPRPEIIASFYSLQEEFLACIDEANGIDLSRTRVRNAVSRWFRSRRIKRQLLTKTQWDMKLLVAAQCDRGQVKGRLDRLADTYGFTGCFQTSARTGQGISELRNALQNGIRWEKLPRIITSAAFAAIRRTFRDLKADDRLFVSDEQILSKASEAYRFDEAEVLAVAHRLQMEGEIHLLNPRPDTTVILLRPELLTAYGSALQLAARSNSERPGTFSGIMVSGPVLHKKVRSLRTTYVT